MLGDLSVIGPQATIPCRVAASATRYEVGEPLVLSVTYTSGAAGTNTCTLAAADFPVADTSGAHFTFQGIALNRCKPLDSGTVVAHETQAARPIPEIGRIRGKAETAGNIDTDAELLAILHDLTLIDYNATGAPDGGELYTIKDTASADTSLLEIIDGNTVKGTLDVLVDRAAYRQIIA